MRNEAQGHWHSVTEVERRRLDDLVGTLPGSVVFRVAVEEDGSVTPAYVSPTIEPVFGLERSAVLHDLSVWLDLMDDDDRAVLRTLRAEAHRRRHAFRHLASFTIGNARSLVEIRCSPLPEAGGRVVWNGVATDVTEATETRQERQRLLDLVEATPDIITVVRADGSYESSNRAARERLGLAPDGEDQRRAIDFYVDGEGERITRAVIAGDGRGHVWSGETTLMTPEGPLPVNQTVVGTTGPDGRITHYASLSRDLTEARTAQAALEAARDQVEVALREVNHRIKNVFALVPALVKLSARTARDVHGLSEAVQARIGALSRSHTLTLTASADGGVALEAVVRAVLAPYADAPDAFALSGPDIRMSGQAGNAVALALHELATNAAKYGALSREGGHVEIEWDVSGGAEGGGLALAWYERDGPPVQGPPSRSGFGTSLLDRLIAAQDGTVEREWRSEGLRVRIALPRG